MYLAVLGATRHFYAMQGALARSQAANNATVNLSACFHQDIKFWRSLCVEMKTRPTDLAKLVHRAASNIGYIYALVQGSGGVWIYPNEDGIIFFWQVK